MTIPGTVPIAGALAPTATTDTYGTHYDIYGIGGYRAVVDNTARDAITTNRRSQGMLVFVTSTSTFYTLNSDLTTWTAFSGGGGGTAGTPYDETPTGTVDGANTTFTITAAPIVGTLQFFVNGVRQLVGVDYTVSSTTITTTLAPEVGSLLRATYWTIAPSVGTIWGAITGTLANQTDLQNALNLKADKAQLPINPRDIGAIGNGASHPLSLYFGTLLAAQAVYPCAVALTDELDWAAIQTAINNANSGVRSVYIPGGIYMINRTLVVPAGLVIRGDGNIADTTYGAKTSIRANAANMLMMSITDQAQLEEFSLNGQDLAYWGIMVSGARPVMRSIEVIRCTEYGVVMNATQNGAFFNLCVRFCLKALVLLNGARNNSFYHYTSETNSTYFTGTFANSALIYYLIDITNPHGFGASTSVTGGGNDRNNFYGGIFERTACVVQSANPHGWSVSYYTHGDTLYIGSEFTPEGAGTGRAFNLDSTFTGVITLSDCVLLAVDPNTALGQGTPICRLNFMGRCNFNAAHNLPLRGITTIASNLLRTMYCDSNEETAPIYGSITNWYQVGTPTISFNGTTKAWSISGAGYNGLGAVPLGILGNGNNVAVLSTVQAIPTTFKVSFTLTSITGGTLVDFYVGLGGSPWRRAIGSFGLGPNEFRYTSQSTDSGAIEILCTSCTGFSISNLYIGVA